MRRITASLTIIFCVASAAMAFDVPKTETALHAKVLALPQLNPNFDATRAKLYLTNPSWLSWNNAHGGNWTAQYDTLSGHPRRVYGGAIPWTTSAAELESVARNFIAQNQSILGVTNANLTFDPVPAAGVKSGRVRFAAFDYSINGVPVEHARLVFAVNNGNMIYWHSANIANVPAVTTPSISASQALANLLAFANVSESNITVVREPSLRLIPRNGLSGALLTYTLVYQAAFRVNGGQATWTALVDALTGSVLSFADDNRYADACAAPSGRVTGGVKPAQATDAEVVRSFPWTATSQGGTTQNGTFAYSGGEVRTRLNGTWFDTWCTDCLKSEEDPQPKWQPLASSTNGLIQLGTGGRDVVTGVDQPTISYGNGTSTPADRTAYYHLNVARMIALKYLDLPWLQTKVEVNVNINDVCNANWNGTAVNFFKAGATGTYVCANTGEIRDVMQHEWGHGLDDNDGEDPGYAEGMGDMATGEAAADFIALFVDHDSCIGQSFYNRFSGPFITDPDTMALATCDGVRNIDELRAKRGRLTTSNVTQKCAIVTTAPYYIGPLLGQGHCEGELWGQVGWHLVHGLSTGRSYGTATLDANKQHFTYAGDPIGADNPALDRDAAWTVLERLYFESRPLVASYAPARFQAMGPSAYDGFMIVDDEGDGLANGTPHGAYINDAYVHHGAEEWAIGTTSPSFGDSKNCTTPATPTVTLAQTTSGGEPSVTLSWTAVAGAASYSVLRNERRHDVFLEVARVSGTSFTDVGLDNGVTYNYRVQANSAGACYAVSGGGVATIAIAQPQLGVRSVAITDSPQGNGDGTLDAGEKATLYIALGNTGLANLTNAVGTLVSATSGVTVTKAGPRTYGAIAAGGTSAPQSYQIALDAIGLLCEANVSLVLNVTSDQGCFAVPVSIATGTSSSSCLVYKSSYAQPASIAITSDKLGACGDGDNTPDPGETIQVTVAVNNTGERTANGVVVRLSTDKNYLSIANDTVSVGSLGPLGTETKVVTFAVVVGSAPHADPATLTATVTSQGSAEPGIRSLGTFVNRDVVKRTLAYDFESGDQGWTASEGGWSRGIAPTTGNLTTLWHSNYTGNRCDSLHSPSLELSSTSLMSFDVAYASEYDGLGYDGANLEVTTDGGETWSVVELIGGYPAASAGTTSCIRTGEPMFAGAMPVMQRYTADLSAFAGKRAVFRFKFVADPLVDATPIGVWLDNISASDVVVSVPSAPCQ